MYFPWHCAAPSRDYWISRTISITTQTQGFHYRVLLVSVFVLTCIIWYLMTSFLWSVWQSLHFSFRVATVIILIIQPPSCSTDSCFTLYIPPATRPSQVIYGLITFGRDWIIYIYIYIWPAQRLLVRQALMSLCMRWPGWNVNLCSLILNNIIDIPPGHNMMIVYLSRVPWPINQPQPRQVTHSFKKSFSTLQLNLPPCLWHPLGLNSVLFH